MRACNNLPQPRCRDWVAEDSSSQCLLVSTVFGTVSSLHPTSFLMIFILVSLMFYPGLALTVARGNNTRTCTSVYIRKYAHAYCGVRAIKIKWRRSKTEIVAMDSFWYGVIPKSYFIFKNLLLSGFSLDCSARRDDITTYQ